MLRASRTAFFLAGVVACGAPRLHAEVEAASATRIGDTVASFGFKDVWFLRRTLDDLPDRALYVLALGTVDCPVTRAALPALKELDAAYASRGVQCVLINAGSRDTLRAWSAACLEHEIGFPIAKDFTGECVEALGIARSGEVVVLDAERRLRYRGPLDGVAAENAAARLPELRRALDALLEGQSPAPSAATPSGVPLTDVAARVGLSTLKVNYKEHVAPLMAKYCERCHRPNTEAPFALLDYDDAAAHAETIAEVVHEERMPPWFASHGQFHDPPVMTWDEKQTIRAWVAAGCPSGEARVAAAGTKIEQPSSAPEPVAWSIGEPDLVIKVPAAHQLPADGYVPYKYVLLPYRFPHDTWIQQCEILPDNPRVVHHCNMAYLESALEWNGAKFILGKVPGVQPMDLSEGVAFRIPKGAMLILQIHYTTTGQPEACQISVGMRFAREVVQRELRFLWMVNTQFAIPPGDGFHRVEANNTLEHDALVIGMFAHMHFRGRDMTFIAHPPGADAERLLTIPNYSFDWQLAYRLENVRHFAKGTRIECISHYDNSKFNPFNPDPAATVREGQQTYQEMLNGVMFYLAEDEQLNLRIDPKTGAAVGQAADAGAQAAVGQRSP